MKNAFKIDLIPATTVDYPVIQNLGRFYIYELSRFCGIPYQSFKCPEDGLIEFDDNKIYFTNENHKAFVIRVDGELAGFVFVDISDVTNKVDYYLSEFFIMAKFQGHGVGRDVAIKIFDSFKGSWALGVIPENTGALAFWRKVVGEYSQEEYNEQRKLNEKLKTAVNPDPHLIIISFKS